MENAQLTTTLAKAKTFIPIIAQFVALVLYQVFNMNIPVEQISAIFSALIDNGLVLWNLGLSLWVIIAKIVDESKNKKGEANLSFWNLWGIAKELWDIVSKIRTAAK